ncbi:MAG: Mur ligase family protein [marine benthic group bacterium]|nr:Mur ligase family protein [Gemmatimonadota bacterium]MCL7978384.1 Mur ligase family protein [Gemmatimonadota bacterium]
MLTLMRDERRTFDSLLQRSPSTRIVWGLDRIRFLLESVGSPQSEFRSILIGGTNGKGSVAAICEAVLREHGSRTGLYTSPHLVDASERIRVDGEAIGIRFLEDCARKVLPAADQSDATFFESLTAVAFLAFARAGVEVAVVEVGLGGRLDATNLLDPDACVITGVAMDHADWLGDTLGQIATEKAGIIKTETPLITGDLEPEVELVVGSRARDLDAPRFRIRRDFDATDIVIRRDGTRFTYRVLDRSPRWGRCPGELDGERFAIPLPGEHQACNVALALSAVAAAGHALQIEPTRIALQGLSWPGRFQVIERGDTTLVLDVAHNPAGVESLVRTLEQVSLPRPLVGLIGVLGDKPWREMLGPLMERVDSAVLTVPPSAPANRSWDPGEAGEALKGRAAAIVPEFSEALARALELAGSGTVLVTGSNHTVGDALRCLQM